MTSSHYRYLVLGASIAAEAAVKALRDEDADGSIGVVGEEGTGPVYRPALSKDLWLDPETSVDDQRLGGLEESGAEVHLGVRAVSVDTEAHTVTCDDGSVLGYDKLLVATGGRPRQLDEVPAGERIVYYRTLADYEQVRALVGDKPRVAVVGGGYIGTEVAAALVQQGCTVTLVHPGEVLGEHVYPASIARTVEGAFTDAGVTVRGGTSVTGAETYDAGVRLRLDDGTTLEVDVVVLGLGIQPASDFLPDTVETADDGGVRVGSDLRTTAPDVWAAGDVAEYPDHLLGLRRVEHVDNAEHMGEVAGRVMAGADETYDYTPMFWSDLFDHWYEAVGDMDASLETVVDERGGNAVVVYYLGEDSVRGVLLWDCDGGIEEAKALLAEQGRPDPESLRGRIG